MRRKRAVYLILVLGFAFCLAYPALTCALEPPAQPSSAELLNKAWEAHGKRDIEATFKYTKQLLDLYKDEADREQGSLKALPKNKDEIEAVASLNDVATAYFIQAESYLRQEKIAEARQLLQLIIDKYSYAQAWDQRGWFWSIKLASEQTVKKIETVSIEIEKKKRVSQLATKISLYDPGKEEFVNYAKYGRFENIGTRDYKYVITDQEGLSEAVGEGIYPNTTSVRWDPALKKALKDKRLEGDLWDFMQSPDLEAAFLKWATGSEPQGIKLFCTALILEKAGLIKHAIKCYYAIVVHFPGSYGKTYWDTPWYVGQAAIAKINFLLKNNPQIGYKLAGADIKIINSYDNIVSNDIAVVSPGKFEKVSQAVKPKPSSEKPAIKRSSGAGKVRTVQYEDGGWQLMVEGKPYVIKGVTYAPTKVGQSPDEGTMTSWMEDDFNNSGRIDSPYESFLDTNPKAPVGDFQLMKDMGVNTIRLYHHPGKINKEVLRDLYNTYGIRVIMGDFLGKYALGSCEIGRAHV